MDHWITSLTESMLRYIGQTVTIFTTSGGLSGSGFTGVLISVDCNVVRLLCDIGAAPACPIGSGCTGPVGDYGFGGCGGYGGGYGGVNPLGAICVIPTCAVAAFTHNAIG
ncbi:MAG: hypothetical protein LBL35_00855 [Clostridiales bacterium]|jgi:hypothetical protein|nr:hypothetical protein [Clostridiales bacterium]